MIWMFFSQLLLLTIVQQTHQQDPKPHILCNNDVVTIDPIWSGRIQHKFKQRLGPGNCTLTLKGLRNGSYVSIPGIEVFQSYGSCFELNLHINNIWYCLRGAKSTNPAFIKIEDGKLVFSLLADNKKDYIFSYFTNGKFCQHVSLYRHNMTFNHKWLSLHLSYAARVVQEWPNVQYLLQGLPTF